MMDWEDVFTAVREETGTGQLYCLGFPRIVKDIFLGNISAARVACAEMQLRRPEVEEVYLQNCVAYRLNKGKPKQKEEENTMAPKEEEDHTIDLPDTNQDKEQMKEYKRLMYRVNTYHPEAKKERPAGIGPYIAWVKEKYPELCKEPQRGHNIQKKAPMTPSTKPPEASAPAAQTQTQEVKLVSTTTVYDEEAHEESMKRKYCQGGGNGFNFKPVVVSVQGTFTLDQLRLIQKGISMLAGNSIEEQNELIHMRKEIGSLLN